MGLFHTLQHSSLFEPRLNVFSKINCIISIIGLVDMWQDTKMISAAKSSSMTLFQTVLKWNTLIDEIIDLY